MIIQEERDFQLRMNNKPFVGEAPPEPDDGAHSAPIAGSGRDLRDRKGAESGGREGKQERRRKGRRTENVKDGEGEMDKVPYRHFFFFQIPTSSPVFN